MRPVKNKKRIDPRYFMDEKTDIQEGGFPDEDIRKLEDQTEEEKKEKEEAEEEKKVEIRHPDAMNTEESGPSRELLGERYWESFLRRYRKLKSTV